MKHQLKEKNGKETQKARSVSITEQNRVDTQKRHRPINKRPHNRRIRARQSERKEGRKRGREISSA